MYKMINGCHYAELVTLTTSKYTKHSSIVLSK